MPNKVDKTTTPMAVTKGRLFERRLPGVAHLKIEIVKRSDQAKGFAVLPRRWVVERTFAWLNRCRRLAKDFENLTETHSLFRLASIASCSESLETKDNSECQAAAPMLSFA